MNRMISKQFEIFNVVISFVAVYVVDSFRRFKESTQVFFHYKAMFTNATNHITKRVFRAINQHITSMDSSAAFPVRRFSTAFAFADAAARTIYSVLAFVTFKLFVAIRTNFYGPVAFVSYSSAWHNCTPFKKIDFSTIIYGEPHNVNIYEKRKN